MIAMTLVINFIVGMIAVLVVVFYFRWRARQAAKTVVTSNAFTELDSQLAGLKPLPA